MDAPLLDPRMVRMPEFAPGEWLNTPHPLTRDHLRGRVALVDFWDYTCVNCIRTLPYVTSWHARYADLGLVVIGVHAPEFSFARSRAQVERAISEYSIAYPVLLDNEYATWDRFANRAWPGKHLIDADGYVRYVREGEGFYAETEQAIQAALRLLNPDLTLPEIMPPLRPEDAPGAVCYRPTPELYAGYERGSLGNRQGYAVVGPVVYEMPYHTERVEPFFYAGGIWRASRESLAFAGQEGGRIVLPYRAVTVNAVLSPSADPVEVALGLRRGDTPPLIEVWQDGEPLPPERAGADILYDSAGISCVLVDRPRMVELVRNPRFEAHELELVFRAHGLALYAFTFTSCVMDEA
jgi:thiol-disulfide isomerase/thioredoxin